MHTLPKKVLSLVMSVSLAALLVPVPALAEVAGPDPAAEEAADGGAIPAEGDTPEAGADASDPVAEFEDDGPSEDPSAGPAADGSEGTADGSEATDVAGVALEAQASEASGTFHGMDWRLTSDGELVLGKAGEEQTLSNGRWMYENDWPWDGSRSAIASVRVEGTVRASGSLGYMFYGCSQLSSLDLSGLDTSAVTSMSSMFSGCSGLSSLDLSGLDTSHVTSMSDMFYGCASLSEVTLGEAFSFAGAGGVRKAYLPSAVWVAGSDGSAYAPSQVPDNAADTYRRSGEWTLSGTCAWRVDGDGALTVRPARGDEGTLAYWGTSAPWYSRRDEISSARFEGIVHADTCFFMFRDCSRLSSLDLSGLDTSAVTNMSSMFSGCSSLAEVTLGEAFSFAGAGGVRQTQLPNAVWVAASDGAMYLSSEVPDNAADTYRRSDEWALSGTCMWRVADGALTVRPARGGEGTLANWWGDVPWRSRAGDISSARFEGTVRASSCHHMFYGCSRLSSLDLSGLDTSSVTDMSSMFSGCSGLSSLDLSGLDTSSATDMSSMFSGCSRLSSLDLSGLDTSAVTRMSSMFSGCSRLSSLDLSGLDTSAVTSMSSMFSGCSRLSSLDLSGLDTSAVTSMSSMFSGCSGLSSLDLSGLDTSYVTGMVQMFRNCSSLSSLDLSGWDTSAARSMYGMFDGCSSLSSLDLSGWDTSAATNMSNMFHGCSGLSSLDLSGWDTSAATDMSSMFSGCSSLSYLDVSGWDTSSVTSMFYMFSGCSRLSSLDLSGWDTYAVADMSGMFEWCSSLAYLDLSGWDTDAVADTDWMFSGCTSLCRVRLGEGCTRMGELPRPEATDGRWLSERTGAWYAPSEIANQRRGVADTYTCSADTKPAGGFADVDAYTPHLEDVLWLSARGISTGYDEWDGTRTFRGMEPVYRQDMAAFLYRLAGKPTYVPTQKDIARFRDVSWSTPHATEIWWLASVGISEGWNVGGAFEFRGGETVKRQDMAAFLRRLAKRMGADADAPGASNPFRDVNASTAHYEDILWLASTGVTRGWDMGDGTFEYRGMSDVVRQDMAAFLHRLDKYVKGSAA